MENQLFGIPVIILCTLLFYQSFNKYKQEQYELSLMLILVGGLLLRIYTSCDFFLHEWDERYHALVAKNLIENPFKPMLYKNPILDYDFKNWAGNHIWVHKQPVPLYTMALSMLIFGKNEIALRIPSILLSSLGILSTYKIGELLYSKKTGLIGAFLFAINGLIIEQTAGRAATDHIDVFFFSFVSFAVYFLLKHSYENKWKYLFFGGIFTGLAILSKWLPALIVILIWLIASYNKTTLQSLIKDGVILSLLIAAIVLPWQLYIYSHFPLEAAWEATYNQKHIFEVLGSHSAPFYYHFDKMRMIFGELVYLPFLWLIYSTIKKRPDKRKVILLIWILIPYIFFTIVKTKMQGYILFTASAIFIMIGFFYDHLQSIQTKRKYLISIISILLFVLPIRYCIERVKPFDDRERKAEWISNLKKLDRAHPNQLKVVFNCRYPIETMFYTDIIAYEILPDKEKLKELSAKNFTVYIDNWKEIPAANLNLDFINYIKITGQH